MTFAEMVIWISPLAFGLVIYLLRDIYTDVKLDLRWLRENIYRAREDLADQKAQIKMLNDSVLTTNKTISALSDSVRIIEIKTVDTANLNADVKQIEKQMYDLRSGYGKILLILQKVVTIIRPKE